MRSDVIASRLGVSRQALEQSGVIGTRGILPRKRDNAFPLPPWEYHTGCATLLVNRIKDRAGEQMVLFGTHMEPLDELEQAWRRAQQEGYTYNHGLLNDVLAGRSHGTSDLLADEAMRRIGISPSYFYKIRLNRVLPRQQRSIVSAPNGYYSKAVDLVYAGYVEIGSLSNGLGDSEHFRARAPKVWKEAKRLGYDYDKEVFAWIMSGQSDLILG